MRVAEYTRYGSPEVVGIVERPEPHAVAREIRVRVHAACVGAADGAARSGTPWFARLAFGLRAPRRSVLGSDFAGIVDEVGPDVTRFAVGDRVFGAMGAAVGAHAEVLVVAESGAIAPLPAAVSMTDAAAACDGALTALPFLRDGAHLRPGQRVLVIGASGSVGAAAVQLAKHLGAHVSAVCGPAHVDLVASLGADRVVDRSTEDALGGPATYDVVFDAVAASTFRRARRALRPGGTYLTTVPSFAILLQQLTSRLGRRRAVILFTGLRKDADKAPDLEQLAALLAAGVLRPPIEREVALEQVAEGYRLVDSGHKGGSVVLRLVPAGAEARA
ncbi:NADPH:quinone reductase-like Zn-dependent oxidoreductase [Agromyces sp. 3263]|uniref:NAD(P)-dependent alcohol dehydrogenase n=1 Tax=Agromyces sp. 3263 TaxID=2817750 RepID=UPI0028588A07|nr:NAD(P)-dependent alcohol dehydrogenase [Agromyces sp. 3263]MDR6908050.1 NADPH:quinone reductase-like Zn-dependent oxidoreductase [Agromyces sp. 3263]